MAMRTSGEIFSVLATPKEKRAVSHIHSADLEGERSQLRSGRGTVRRTRAFKNASGMNSISHHGALARCVARVCDKPQLIVSEACEFGGPERGAFWVRCWGVRPSGIITSALFLEQVFEGLPGVQRARWSHRRGGNIVGLRVGGRSGVFLDRGSEGVKRAIVFYVFGSDTLGHGLRTLKAYSGIEKTALFATMQLKLALGASPFGVEAGRQHRAAIRAARAGYRANHARSARTELIGAARTTCWRLSGLLFFFFVHRVTIAAVTVLAIHTCLFPSDTTDCHNFTTDFRC